MARPLDRRSDLTLVLQAVAGNPAGKDLTLLVHEREQEVGVLIIDVLDAVALEAAVLFSAPPDLWVRQKLDVISGCHNSLFNDFTSRAGEANG